MFIYSCVFVSKTFPALSLILLLPPVESCGFLETMTSFPLVRTPISQTCSRPCRRALYFLIPPHPSPTLSIPFRCSEHPLLPAACQPHLQDFAPKDSTPQNAVYDCQIPPIF